jgi:hypothetical protein
MRRAFMWLVVFAAVLGVGIGASYAAGYIYGRSTAPQATATPAAAQGQAGGTGAGGAAGQAQRAGTGTATAGGQSGRTGTAAAGAGQLVGTVQSVDGKTLKVMPAGGTETTVTLGDSTQVGTVSTSDAGAISEGSTVLLVGQRAQDGAFTPTSVIILPEGFTVR